MPSKLVEQSNRLSKTITNLFSNPAARSEGCCLLSSCNRSWQTTLRWCVMGWSHKQLVVWKVWYCVIITMVKLSLSALMLCQRWSDAMWTQHIHVKPDMGKREVPCNACTVRPCMLASGALPCHFQHRFPKVAACGVKAGRARGRETGNRHVMWTRRGKEVRSDGEPAVLAIPS
jgi:hypothetical protein